MQTYALAVVEVVGEIFSHPVFVGLVEERRNEGLSVRRARVR